MVERTKVWGLSSRTVSGHRKSQLPVLPHKNLRVWARGDHFLEGQGGGGETCAAFWSSAPQDKGDPRQGTEVAAASSQQAAPKLN